MLSPHSNKSQSVDCAHPPVRDSHAYTWLIKITNIPFTRDTVGTARHILAAICVQWHGTWLWGVHRTRRDDSSFMWHQPCQSRKYTTYPGTSRNFPPRDNFQCRHSYGVRTAPRVQSHASASVHTLKIPNTGSHIPLFGHTKYYTHS